jgi:hypothetical protein
VTLVSSNAVRISTPMSAFQAWCLRSCLIFAGVLLLGVVGLPTQLPYITALLLVGGDAVRVWKRRDDRRTP